MKKIIFICLLIVANFGFADSHFLNVTSEGLNLLITPKKNTVYPIAGINVLTPGVTVQSGCKKNPNGFCIFNTRKGKVTQLTMSRAGTFRYVMCLNAIDHLQCQYYGSTVAESFSHIYVANTGSGAGGNLEVCSLTNGVIQDNSCTVNDILGDSSNARYLSINKKAKKIYITRIPNLLTTCSLATNGAITTPCVTYDQLNIPADVLYNEKFNKVYIANSSSDRIAVCTLNASGLIQSCTQKSDLSFDGPIGLAINNTINKIYISNSFLNTISICNLASNGNIGSCSSKAGFNSPQGVAINVAAQKLYVAGSPNIIYTCVLAANGAIGACTQKPFNSPTGLALNAGANKLYITQSAQEIVSTCNLSALGVIGSCINSPTLGPIPTGVSLN